MNTRNVNIVTGFTLAFFILFSASCRKEYTDYSLGVNPTPAGAPNANAGPDITITLPLDAVILHGSYRAGNQEIRKIEWTNISGPDSCVIEEKNLLTTNVKGLKEGTYAFELALTNGSGLTGRDTVSVVVKKAPVVVTDPPPTVVVGTNEVTYTNIRWIYPWYNTLEAPRVYSYVPQNKPIKVFVKRDYATDWVEVPLISSNSSNSGAYEYFIETRPDGAGMYTYGSLFVFYYGDDSEDTPDVKITF